MASAASVPAVFAGGAADSDASSAVIEVSKVVPLSQRGASEEPVSGAREVAASSALFARVAKRPLCAAVAALLAVAVAIAIAVIAVAASRGAGGGGGGGASTSAPQQIALSQMANPCTVASAPGCLATLAVTWVIPHGSSYTIITPPTSSTRNWVPLSAITGGGPASSPRVEYGAAAGRAPGAPLRLTGTANLSTYTYTGGTDWRGATSNYTSPAIYSAEVKLPPGTRFAYRVGDDANGFSPVFEAAMPPAVGAGPNIIAWAGDLGQSGNTSRNLDRILAQHAVEPVQAFLHAGDLSYADGEGPAWDSWGVLMQKVSSVIPFNTAVGNHEALWNDAPFNTFATFMARMRGPHSAAANNVDALYHSLNVGLVHVIFLNAYCSQLRSYMVFPNACLAPGSAQAAWLKADLAAVDRQLTPWTVVVEHAPYYNSASYHANATEGYIIQAALEDQLHDVDIVIHGHVHTYERSCRVVHGRCDTAGRAPAYIVLGDGGNREAVGGGGINNGPNGPQKAYPWLYPQPPWSMFRQGSFGHGIMTAVNATHLHWQWRQAWVGAPDVGDDFWFVKGTSFGTCGDSVERANFR